MPRWSTAPPLCSPTEGGTEYTTALFLEGTLRPVGMTDREFQERKRLYEALRAYSAETGRHQEWVSTLPAAQQESYYQLLTLFIEYWVRVEYLIDSVPYPGKVWSSGGFGTGSGFVPRPYNATDYDPEVTSGCADLCTDWAQREYVKAGGKGCTVKWQNDCFFVTRPPHTWAKKLAAREFGCAGWNAELNQAIRDLSETVQAIDELHGEAIYIDPKTGLSTAEMLDALVDYNETAQDNTESAYEWPGLGPLGTEWRTWAALGIGAIVVAIVVK